MSVIQRLFLFAIVFSSARVVLAWTSPGLGAVYTPDALVSASSGALTGAWPDYVQQEDILISANDGLHWPAGTQWQAAAGVELRVEGLMRATGTPWNPVAAVSVSGLPDSWSGLILADADPASLLRCVTISGGADGLNCLGSSPTVEYCTLSGNFSSGLHCFLGSSPTLRHCLIEGNLQYGVEITGGCSPVLEHCVIRGNNVEAASPRNAVSVGIQGSNSPRLVSCLLEGSGPQNPASGFSLWMSGTPRLSDCEIRGFRSGVVIQGSGAEGLLERCWIHNSRYTNPIQGGSGINVNTTATPVFRGCAIEDNDWGVTITSTCAPVFGTSMDHGMNRLHGNGNGGSVWDFYNNTTGALQARGNWWGTTDPALIDLHIHDDADGAFGDVAITPILEDSLFAPLLSPDLGYIALAAGMDWTFDPRDHFRGEEGLSFALEGPGLAEDLGDSLRWTPPAGSDSLLTLRLYAETLAGMQSCDTMRVWLQPAAAEELALSLRMLGSDAVLDWTEVPGAIAYRVERSLRSDFATGTVTIVHEGPERDAVDPGVLQEVAAFYRVVAVLPDR